MPDLYIPPTKAGDDSIMIRDRGYSGPSRFIKRESLDMLRR